MTKGEKKAEVLRLMREGVSVKEAARRLKISDGIINSWRREDENFKILVQRAIDETKEIREEIHRRRVHEGHGPAKLPAAVGTPCGTKKVPQYVDAFLYNLAKGMSVTRACEAAQLSPITVYAWKKDDPEFAKRWAEAARQGTDRLEDEAYRRAVTGVEKPVFQGGEVVGYVTEYSDSLLALMLRGKRPEVYARPETSVGIRATVQLTQEQAAERLRQLGLPVPFIETEYDDVTDARAPGASDQPVE